MDATFLTIYAGIAIAFVWLTYFVIKLNRSRKIVENQKSVKDSLFGKKKRKQKKENWSFAE